MHTNIMIDTKPSDAVIKATMAVKVRKWLPSYVTVTRIVKPKKGRGSYNRRKLAIDRNENFL